MNYQLLVIVCFLSAFILMKVWALKLSPSSAINFFFNTPVFAPTSCKRNQEINAKNLKHLKRHFFLFSVLGVAGIEFYQFVFKQWEMPLAMKSVLFYPYIYIFTNLLGLMGQVWSLLGKQLAADLHNKPYLASSVSEFWGKRWNIWISDWLGLVSKKFSKNPSTRLFLAFFLSSLYHEAVIALPFYLWKGKNYFGWMSLFFMSQYISVAVDKKILSKKFPALRRPFLWIALILPAPLFVNPSVLSFFGVK